MKDKFDFLRKIFSSENPDLLLKAYKSLSNEGLESKSWRFFDF